jgi:hypothetical protein
VRFFFHFGFSDAASETVVTVTAPVAPNWIPTYQFILLFTSAERAAIVASIALHCVVGLRSGSPLTAVRPLAANAGAFATGSVSPGSAKRARPSRCCRRR